MDSLILRAAARFLLPLVVLFSIFLLFRGHHEPGGGFVGGLMAAAAIALYAIALDVPAARDIVRLDTDRLIGLGLLTALGSGLVAPLTGEPFLTGKWRTMVIPGLGRLELGTPLLFDAGVYLVVVGVTLLIIFSLLEEQPTEPES